MSFELHNKKEYDFEQRHVTYTILGIAFLLCRLVWWRFYGEVAQGIRIYKSFACFVLFLAIGKV
jgi:hypothetical protein